MTIKQLGIRTQLSIIEVLSSIKDQKLRNWVYSFLLSSEVYDNFSINTDNQIYKIGYATKQFLLALVNTKQNLEEMNWDSYCKQMHEINKSTRTDDSKKSRKILQAFYFYTYKNHSYNSIKNNLKPYLKFLLDHELRFDEIDNEIFSKRMLTNFPVGATPEKLHQVKEIRGNNTFNLLINTDNRLLVNLLKCFINSCESQGAMINRILSRNGRAYFYYFQDSIKKDIEKITDFNRETFIQQFNYFDTFPEQPYRNSAITLLRSFYIFLDKYNYNETNNILFPSVNFNRTLLTSGWFSKYLTEGYDIVYRSQHESLPSSDRLVVVRRAINKKSRSTYYNIILDFTVIENKTFRQELKEYLWHLDIDDNYMQRQFSAISGFLNYTHEYIENRKNILQLQQKKTIFTDELILSYLAWVKSRKNDIGELLDTGTVNLLLGSVKQYLRHIKDRYYINELTITRIKTKAVDDENSGNPMTREDFDAISKAFRESKYFNINSELYYIIFKLSATTKLRKGEILNLKTSCIISKFDKHGIIKYIPKTEYEPLEEEFLIEDILLIERAIELTRECRTKAINDLKQYIFISYRTKHREEVKMIGQDYENYFNEIINDLYKNGKISKIYTPYNSRDTFINSVYEMVEDNQISTLEGKVIAGNSEKVAAKHYRQHNVIRYLEATYMITIGDVNIHGKITLDESEIKDLQEVEQGAGGCKSDGCIKFNNDEDTAFKCLTCNKFVTSLSRQNVFETRLKRYSEFRDKASSKIEHDYYSGLCELYGKYLAEFYMLLEVND